MSGYVAREGSVSQRVIWHLEQHGACSSKRIADEVDDVAASGLPANLATAVRLGALFVRKVDGECWYDVKPFAPGAELKGIDLDKAQERKGIHRGRKLQHVLKAEPATADATDRSQARPASPRVGAMGTGQAADAAPDGETIADVLREAARNIPRIIPTADQCVIAQASDAPFRCALWSDGSFTMFLPDGTDAHLTPAETKVLVRYLDRLAGEATS